MKAGDPERCRVTTEKPKLPAVKQRVIGETEYLRLSEAAARVAELEKALGERAGADDSLLGAILVGLDDLQRAIQAARAGGGVEAIAQGVELVQEEQKSSCSTSCR